MVLHRHDSGPLGGAALDGSDTTLSITVTTSDRGATLAVQGAVDDDAIATLRRVLAGLPDAEVRHVVLDLRHAVVTDRHASAVLDLTELLPESLIRVTVTR
jgi:hypothetical protein